MTQKSKWNLSNTLAWLSAHKVLTFCLATAYFLITVLSHETVGAFLANTLNINEPQSFNKIFTQGGIIAIVIYLALTLPPILKKKRWATLYYLIGTLLITAACVPTLIVVNSEFIHFFQYALLSFLLLPLLQSYWLALVVGTILGIIDEWIQYTIISAGRTQYFDFNDVVLNLLGSAIGLISIGAIVHQRYPVTLLPKTGWYVLGALVTFFFITWLANGIDIYPDSKNPAPFTLIKTKEKTFWTVLPPHRRFHVLRPLEGLLLLSLLFGLGSQLDKVLLANSGIHPTKGSPDPRPS